MKKILLTGSRGFFGSRFIRAFGQEFNLIATNSDTLNITDGTEVERAVVSAEPDYIMHAAAVAETAFCDNHPEICRPVNVEGTRHLAGAAERSGARLVFLSTEQVFNGNPEPGPYKENHPPIPDTEYGRNKLEAESIIINTCHDYLILRLTWLFGLPSKSFPVSPNLLWNTVQAILKGEPFGVSPREYRGITSIDDLLGRFKRIFELPAGIYHTGSENELSRYDTVRHIFKEMGIEGRFEELVFSDDEKYAGKARDVRLDTSMIRSLGVEFPDSSEALSRCIRENYLSV